MKRWLVALPLCLALISCDDPAVAPTAPTTEVTLDDLAPPDWPSVHDSLTTVPEGDCALIGGRQRIGCVNAPLDKLLRAVDMTRSRGTPKISFFWITGAGGSSRCTVVVNGVWDNDYLKIVDDIGRRREILVTYRDDPQGPWLVCRDDGIFPTVWSDGTPIKSQRSARAERWDSLSIPPPIGRSQ